MGRITDLQLFARELARAGKPMVLLKSDFKAAYRSLPVQESHLPFAATIFRDPHGQLAMPVASVFAWDRLGAALAAILQEFLLIPCPQYVDDLFWADFALTAAQGRAAAMELISLLAFTLEETKTPWPSVSQGIVGVRIFLGEGGTCMWLQPELAKRDRWLQEILEVLADDRVQARRAS